MLLSRAITRMLCGVFGGPATICPLRCWICWQITATPSSRSTSRQRSPAASPRRSPRSAMTWKAAYSRWSLIALRNCAVCVTVHTATGGRSPVRRQCSTLAAVHTTARGRRAAGNATNAAAFSSTNPSRSAAFKAVRNVARIRCTVAAVNGRPIALWSRTIALNISSTCATDNSARRIRPRCGFRYRRAWSA